MPDWPPEAITGGDAPNQRKVSVFVEGNGMLWLNSDDLEWMIRFLCIQQQLKGVPVVAPDDPGPDAAERMDFEMTPEKCPRPKQDNGHIFDKWDAEREAGFWTSAVAGFWTSAVAGHGWDIRGKLYK